jgi:hypothetical protein
MQDSRSQKLRESSKRRWKAPDVDHREQDSNWLFSIKSHSSNVRAPSGIANTKKDPLCRMPHPSQVLLDT